MSVTYKLSAPHRASHFAEIEMTVDNIVADEVIFELPSWRPGRYELGNFAKNVRRWRASNEKGHALAFRKTAKDSWKVLTEGATRITINYEYYSFQPDAGGCYIDESQIYINPVHCFLFLNERIHEPCIVELNIPDSYRIATSLKLSGKNILHAVDFHELADSPFIASDTIQQKKYTVGSTEFFIWFQGNCQPGWERIIKDFEAFSKEQLKLMGEFPFKEYHFLIQVLPYAFYHGVEHLHSTVLALGPGDELMNDDLYENLTGVASHELFHTWNVKSIRPVEMLPYNYKKENYSRLGYVYEGVTSYYGDLILARCGVYTAEQFFNEISVRIQKHFDNPGRFNLSVADSSFDTWLDGYTPGIPGRKTSIYDEGCVTALMTDLLIRKYTNSKSSLDDVMRTLYSDFGKGNTGYSEHDYISLVEFISKRSMSDFFLDYVYGVEEYENLLGELLSLAGCELKKNNSSMSSESKYGFKTVLKNKTTSVSLIAPLSPAYVAGLGVNDEIVAVNENKVEENFDSLLNLYTDEKIVLTVITPMRILKDLALNPSAEKYFPKYTVRKNQNASEEAKLFYKNWINREFEESLNLEKRKSK